MVYQLCGDVRRLLYVGQRRDSASLSAFFDKMGASWCAGVAYVCTDMRQAYLNATLNKRWLKTVRAYLWKEKFQRLWDYTSPYWARWYLRRWRRGAMRSRLAPLKRFARTSRIHEDLITNRFEAKKAFSSGAVEGMNRKIDLITRRAYGFNWKQPCFIPWGICQNPTSPTDSNEEAF